MNYYGSTRKRNHFFLWACLHGVGQQVEECIVLSLFLLACPVPKYHEVLRNTCAIVVKIFEEFAIYLGTVVYRSHLMSSRYLIVACVRLGLNLQIYIHTLYLFIVKRTNLTQNEHSLV